MCLAGPLGESDPGTIDPEADRTNGVTYRSKGRVDESRAGAGVNREPSVAVADPKALMLGQLAHLRAAAVDKLDGLSDAQLRSRPLPSGWSPLEMLNHLLFMERRWVEWGFAGRAVERPQGDRDAAGRFRLALPADRNALEVLAELSGALDEQARRTEVIAAGAELEARAQLGGQFSADPPTLGWILLHVLQEYARHAGQLDVVRELIDRSTGE